jgi:hypothetical protein
MRKALLLLPLMVGSCLAFQATPARALNTICTAAWSGSNVAAGGTSSATPIVGSGYNCPSSTVNTTVTVGTGANAGVINAGSPTWGSATGSTNYPTTSNSSIDIGIPANSNENLTVTFSQTVYNPYLYFSYGDVNTSFTFSGAFSLLQANNATRVGNSVQFTGGSNTENDGFVVQVAGSYGPSSNLTFNYNNATGSVQSVAFTTGVYNVPGPLPLLGGAVAFGMSRRLRRRIRAGA